MLQEELEEYDEEEAEEFAIAMAEKAYAQAIQNGNSEAEAKKIAQEKYNEVRKRHILEFLKKIEEKLSSLSNQTVANLLRILIALGLDIEDEEELEAWINRLTLEAFNRINLYFNERDNISLWRQLTTQPKTQKVLYNLKNYSTKDIEILKSMISSLNKVNDKKTKNDKSRIRRKDILKKIDKVLNKDIKLKEQQQNKLNNKSQRRQEDKSQQTDSYALLTGKMTAEGVDVGGRYWNEVISDYNRSDNKTDFATNWQIDNVLRNDLDIRYQNDKQREDERFLAENEEHQRMEQENQRKQREQEDISKQEQQELKKRQEEKARQAEQEKQNREREKIQEKRGITVEQKAKEQSQNKLKTAQQMAARGGRSGGNNSR